MNKTLKMSIKIQVEEKAIFENVKCNILIKQRKRTKQQREKG